MFITAQMGCFHKKMHLKAVMALIFLKYISKKKFISYEVLSIDSKKDPIELEDYDQVNTKQVA